MNKKTYITISVVVALIFIISFAVIHQSLVKERDEALKTKQIQIDILLLNSISLYNTISAYENALIEMKESCNPSFEINPDKRKDTEL